MEVAIRLEQKFKEAGRVSEHRSEADHRMMAERVPESAAGLLHLVAAEANAVDAWLERRVLRSADRVIAVTDAIARDIKSRLDVAVAVVPHGWDPALEDAVARATPPETSPDHFSLVHTGLLGEPAGRDSAALFGGLRLASSLKSRSDPRMAGQYHG